MIHLLYLVAQIFLTYKRRLNILHDTKRKFLSTIVSHRKIILPQLGAPGVAAHQVKQISGFKVYYGPIRASDLPAYLDSGLKATKTMRLVTFPLKDRAVLIPLELLNTAKPFILVSLALLILSGILGQSGFQANIFQDGLLAVGALACAVAGGVILNPLLLPYLPGRAFSISISCRLYPFWL
jgi:acetyl-CoA decarbonylase/synthase complex subunit gamma